MKGKNILLRALEPTDVDILYKWENDTSIWKISNTFVPFSKFIIEQYIINSHEDIYTTKQLRLMIDLTDGEDKENKTVGTIDLFEFDPHNKRAGIAILIRKDKRQLGYASEALEILIDYAFNTLNLHQLFCNIDAQNKASLKLFCNFNFKIIGLKKDWTTYNDKWVDVYMLQLLKQNKD